MFNLTVVLIVLALDAWLWRHYDWRAGVAALAIAALSYLLGHVMMRRDLERAGYVAEYRPDARGKRRWRIGVKAPPKKVEEADVQWFPPGGAWASRRDVDPPPPPFPPAEPSGPRVIHPKPPGPPPITPYDMH